VRGLHRRTGIPTVALRPAWVWDPGMYHRIEAQWQADPASEWTPTWEYGQFIDVRDVAGAVRRALEVPLEGHHRVLLCAPSVPVHDATRFQREPRRALFDCSAAHRVLGWQPHYRWSTRGRDQSG
jgi:UDP-glucose 4-epimerase